MISIVMLGIIATAIAHMQTPPQRRTEMILPTTYDSHLFTTAAVHNPVMRTGNEAIYLLGETPLGSRPIFTASQEESRTQRVPKTMSTSESPAAAERRLCDSDDAYCLPHPCLLRTLKQHQRLLIVAVLFPTFDMIAPIGGYSCHHLTSFIRHRA
ncbi:hypothetical protein F5887DRAFT_225733 [Amanita rubescens]|nr:hypothetical protein F5887DRAFT_225733 [Amanita rubescens]